MLSKNKQLLCMAIVISLIIQPLSFSFANSTIISNLCEKPSTDYVLSTSEENDLALHDTTYKYFSTFLGGSDWEYGMSVAVDSDDNKIVAGHTSSEDFPVLNGFSEENNDGDQDVFVCKFDSSGNLTWSTYLGGNDTDSAWSVAIDSFDNIIVAGETDSRDFPVLNGFNETYAGGREAFVCKFNSNGSLLWNTFLGGFYYETLYSIVIDSNDNIIVTGYTNSADFPVLNGYFDKLNGSTDAFVTKYSSSGSLIWSTYLGGSSGEAGHSVAVDSEDNLIVTGQTKSDDFPVLNGYNETYGGDPEYDGDVFITKFNSAGNLVWSTYLGGSEGERAFSVDVDSQDSIIVTGKTVSSDFPVLNGFNETYAIGIDVFVSKFDFSGNMIWSSYINGNYDDEGRCVKIDSLDNIIITGYTRSDDFPVINGYDESFNGGLDVFVTTINSSGNIIWSTFLGSTAWESGSSVTVDSLNNIIITGYTKSTSFPLLSSFDSTFNGSSDAFLCCLSDTPLLDEDGDGLATYLEFNIGTDPLNADTDEDGLLDGEEVNTYETNPIEEDTDEDGLLDGEEVITYETNPLINDTDEDGLLDGVEVSLGTNPLVEDTDEDGLSDIEEVNTYETNPLIEDTDSDGLLDGEEVNTYETNPLVADTDEDGLLDGEEISRGTNPLVGDSDNDGLLDGEEISLGTNPLAEDTDSDGLSDIDEVNTYKTNPLAKDTDGDGYSDGEEVDFGSDPLNKWYNKRNFYIAIIASVIILVITIIGLIYYIRKKRRQNQIMKKQSIEEEKEKLNSLIKSISSFSSEMESFDDEVSSLQLIEPSNESVEKLLAPYSQKLQEISSSLLDLELPKFEKEWLIKAVKAEFSEAKELFTPLSERLEILKSRFDNRSQELETEALLLRRRETLEKILPKFARMTVDEFARYLEFEDIEAMKMWVFDLSADYPLILDGNDITVDRSKLSSSDQLSDAIDDLLANFASMEKTKKGKLE